MPLDRMTVSLYLLLRPLRVTELSGASFVIFTRTQVGLPSTQDLAVPGYST
jgi:hypothetical protein